MRTACGKTSCMAPIAQQLHRNAGLLPVHASSSRFGSLNIVAPGCTDYRRHTHRDQGDYLFVHCRRSHRL
jgi:hypothetical protein